MNAIREILGEVESLSTSIFDDVMGETVTYYFQRTGTIIENVACMPIGPTRVDNANPGANIRRDTVEISIPRQDIWPLTEVPTLFDSVTYRGEMYWVKTGEWTNLDGIWSVRAEKKRSA